MLSRKIKKTGGMGFFKSSTLSIAYQTSLNKLKELNDVNTLSIETLQPIMDKIQTNEDLLKRVVHMLLILYQIDQYLKEDSHLKLVYLEVRPSTDPLVTSRMEYIQEKWNQKKMQQNEMTLHDIKNTLLEMIDACTKSIEERLPMNTRQPNTRFKLSLPKMSNYLTSNPQTPVPSYSLKNVENAKTKKNILDKTKKNILDTKKQVEELNKRIEFYKDLDRKEMNRYKNKRTKALFYFLRSIFPEDYPLNITPISPTLPITDKNYYVNPENKVEQKGLYLNNIKHIKSQLEKETNPDIRYLLEEGIRMQEERMELISDELTSQGPQLRRRFVTNDPPEERRRISM
jgi:hypothetical protein